MLVAVVFLVAAAHAVILKAARGRDIQGARIPIGGRQPFLMAPAYAPAGAMATRGAQAGPGALLFPGPS